MRCFCQVARAVSLILALLAVSGGAKAQLPPPACAPLGMSRAELDALKASQWVVADEARRNGLARALVDCLGDPDPEIRDGIAFEGLQHLMRAGQLGEQTLAALQDALQANMAAPDPAGFRSSFSALALADVVRTDRVRPWMTAERRARALDAAVAYLAELSDHRGFDPRHGYRHAPAHAGDLMAQIALNPAYGRPELGRVLDAIARQIAPNENFYVNGESERLARPVLIIAQRNLFGEADWTAWLALVSGPGPLGRWDGWFRSNAGLARRHNLTMFLLALHANASLARNAEAFAPIRPGLATAIRAMP